ncbi:MAG: hypothetical protein OXU61_09060, partial [Gammaproteobacteria bacterium]|nr:hypothetical protein [Gammaproteobacteria bacterium]
PSQTTTLPAENRRSCNIRAKASATPPGQGNRKGRILSPPADTGGARAAYPPPRQPAPGGLAAATPPRGGSDGESGLAAALAVCRICYH